MYEFAKSEINSIWKLKMGITLLTRELVQAGVLGTVLVHEIWSDSLIEFRSSESLNTDVRVNILNCIIKNKNIEKYLNKQHK